MFDYDVLKERTRAIFPGLFIAPTRKPAPARQSSPLLCASNLRVFRKQDNVASASEASKEVRAHGVRPVQALRTC
jgi:hypothetical protein